MKVESRPSTLVWIDSREAIIVRWHNNSAEVERVESEVPAHRRATGHVRHDPAIRHGGGGSPQTAGERHRLEHLKRFVVEIADRLSPGDDLLILGTGTVHERLARHMTESDERQGRHRDIACETNPPLTDRQLLARLRGFAGAETRRRTVGAYRWADLSAHRASGKVELAPRRVIDKPPRERGRRVP
jgi:hypothetical protein